MLEHYFFPGGLRFFDDFSWVVCGKIQVEESEHDFYVVFYIFECAMFAMFRNAEFSCDDFETVGFGFWYCDVGDVH